MTKHKTNHHENDEDNSFDAPIFETTSKYGKKYRHDIIAFQSPESPTNAEEKLIADIVSLDHRSVHGLKPGTKEREEVKLLLYNSIVCLLAREEVASRKLYAKAEAAYYNHLQSSNRLKYLSGMLFGTLVSISFVAGLAAMSSLLYPVISTQLLILLTLFSGMGSIASVLTRLSSIDLRQQTSNFMILVSGGTRPIVAIFFSVVVYIILKEKILDIHFGSTEGNNDSVYIVTAFLCGFSERFAKDILAKIDSSISNSDHKE
jgi:hypothetical protein